MLLPLLLACASDPKAVSLEVTADPENVLRAVARWDADVAPGAHVAFGDGQRTPATDAGEAILVGMPAETDIPVRLVGSDGATLAETTHTTGRLPSAVPELAPEGTPFGEGWVVTTSFGFDGSPPVALAVDGEGRVGWYHMLDDLGAAFGGHPTTWALRLDDAGAVWLGVADETYQGYLRVPFDGSAPTRIDAPGAHHDFELLPDGSLAYTRAEERVIDDSYVTGDSIVVRAPDGTERVAWSAFDTLEVQRHSGWDTFSSIRGDWTHANGLAWDADAGRWSVSLYWLHQLVTIDDASGTVISVLDGHTTPERFGPQHAQTWVGDGWWLFDNAAPGAGSRALHLAPEGTLLGEWRPPTGGFAGALGDVTPLADGRLLVTTGVLPDLWFVAPDVEETFHLKWPQANSVGQAAWTPTLYAH
jgi:hypothetical protein